MALADREQLILDTIEVALSADDPQLAALLTGDLAPRATARVRRRKKDTGGERGWWRWRRRASRNERGAHPEDEPDDPLPA